MFLFQVRLFLVFNGCSILQFYRTQKLLKVFFRKNLENSTEKRYLETICTSSSFLRLTSNLTSLSRTAAYDLLWSLVNFSAVAPENLISHLFCQTSRLLSDIRKTLSGFGLNKSIQNSDINPKFHIYFFSKIQLFIITYY